MNSTLDDVLNGVDAPVQNDESRPENTQVEQPETEAKAAEENTATDEEGTGEDGRPMAPVSALTAERRKYKENLAAVERQMAESNQQWQQRFEQLLQTIKPPEQPKPAEPEPDFWEDPTKFVMSKLEAQQRQFEMQRMQERDAQSRFMAEKEFGSERVNNALANIRSLQQANPQVANVLLREFNSSPHPYGKMLDWFDRASQLATFGNDPSAYEAQLRAKIREEMQAEMQQQEAPQAQPANGNMPSNFTTSRNVGSRSGPTWSGPSDISEIFAMDRTG